MASLVSYPVPAYKLGAEQYTGDSFLEFINTFRSDPNTFISNNDKLHKWAMWRTQVNNSFIRNLPIATDMPRNEAAIREKRIDIGRFLVHSDTDELKRLEMRQIYGRSDENTSISQLGHGTYFLYGIPRVLIGQDIIEGKEVTRVKGPKIHEDRVRTPTPTPTPPSPPPPKREHLFVGSSQLVMPLNTDESDMPLELSHAQRATSVFANKMVDQRSRIPSPQQRLDEAESEVKFPEEQHGYELWKKMYLIKDKPIGEDDESVHNFNWESGNDFNEDSISNISDWSRNRN